MGTEFERFSEVETHASAVAGVVKYARTEHWWYDSCVLKLP